MTVRDLLLALASPLALACAPRTQPRPELAPAGDHFDLLHETRVPDPYRWMEEEGLRATAAWVDEHDRHARAWVAAAPGHAQRLARIHAASLPARYLAPLERGGRYFLPRVDAAVTRTTWLVRDGWNGAERVLVDGDELFRQQRTCDRYARPSADGTRLAVTEGAIGSSWRTIRVLDVTTGRWLPERIPGFVSGASSLAWHPSGAGFFHTRFAPPLDEQGLAPFTRQRVEYHELGASEEHELLAPVEDGTLLSLAATDDGRMLVLTLRDSRAGLDEVRVAEMGAPLGPWRTLIPGGRGTFTFAGSHGDELWFQTTLGAPNGRVVSVRATRSTEAPVELVPESTLAIDTWITNGVRAVGQGLIVTYRKEARLVPRLFDADGRFVREIELPYLGSVWSGWVGRSGNPEVFYVLSGFVDPGTVYRLDLASGRSEAALAPELSYAPGEFVTRQEFWSGPAGERLPMFLAYHRSTPPGRERPVLLYGYAFGGWSAAPWFRPHMPEWLRSGGVFALPALRGGGEFGESWHADGVGRKRQNAIDDYVACARWLAAHGLARSEWIAAETNSAGASVVAAALLQAPEAFGAGILAFPLLDVLRYDRFTAGAAWRSELGSPADPDDFRSLLSYAPIQAVRSGVTYPPLLVTPGELDQVTPPVHAYKFVATLEAAGAPAPTLLRLARGAGHAYGADLASSAENLADQLSFLARVFGSRR
jgi:prolyl oligopeptidase